MAKKKKKKRKYAANGVCNLLFQPGQVKKSKWTERANDTALV